MNIKNLGSIVQGLSEDITSGLTSIKGKLSGDVEIRFGSKTLSDKAIEKIKLTDDEQVNFALFRTAIDNYNFSLNDLINYINKQNTFDDASCTKISQFIEMFVNICDEKIIKGDKISSQYKLKQENYKALAEKISNINIPKYIKEALANIYTDQGYSDFFNKKGNSKITKTKIAMMLGLALIGGGMVKKIKENYKAKIYVVQKGDTLRHISKKQGVSVKYLKLKNDLDDDNINIGQKIKL